MADYQSSVIAKAQAVITPDLQQYEQRRFTPTALALAVKNQNYSIPDAQALRVSPKRVVDIYFYNKVAAGSDTAKEALHSGGYGDSSSTNLVYVSYVEKIGMPIKIADNNFMTYQGMFNNLYQEKWKNLIDRHNNYATSFLQTNRVQLAEATMKSQLQVSGLANYWNGTNSALEIPATLRNRYIDKVKAAMKARSFKGELDILADVSVMSEVNFYMNQGAGNFNNTSYQFMGCNFAESQVLIDSAYGSGTSLVMPKGSFAGLIWNEAANRENRANDREGAIGTLTTVNDPFGLGLTADLSMYRQRADTSANTSGGSTQDMIDQYEITLTVAYALAPLVTSLDSVVMEAVIMPDAA